MLASRCAQRLRSSAFSRACSAEVRVRYAPSPTGYLHLGGLRTALFNYLFAARHNGVYLLRIEDTDKARPDVGGPHGPYVQSERLELYKRHADELVERGTAYRCFCTPERLDQLRQSQQRAGVPTMYDRACMRLSPEESRARVANGEQHTVRLKVPAGTTLLDDLVRGKVSFTNSTIDDQVLLKSDGFPTYHLANVVDDYHMRISHVLRGEEWLPSTPKHVLLYHALGWPAPQFAHLPLLLNPDRSKLSKRQGDVAVEDFAAQGYLPEALVNFVALLGWSPSGGDTQEVFSLQELAQRFSLAEVSKSGAVADRARLDWLNGQHVRRVLGGQAPHDASRARSLVEEVAAKLDAHLATRHDAAAASGGVLARFGEAFVTQAVQLLTERVKAPSDFVTYTAYFFADPDLDSPASRALRGSVWKEDQTDAHIQAAIAHLEQVPQGEFVKAKISPVLKSVAKTHKLALKQLLLPVRFAVTGLDVGADLGMTLELLGKETVLRRLRSAVLRSDDGGQAREWRAHCT